MRTNTVSPPSQTRSRTRLPRKQHRRRKGESVESRSVDEGRRRVLLIAAAILAARRLAQFPATPRVPATMSAIADAIRFANQIMIEIDKLWPTKSVSCSRSSNRTGRFPASGSRKRLTRLRVTPPATSEHNSGWLDSSSIPMSCVASCVRL
jgi:hypothetical protein